MAPKTFSFDCHNWGQAEGKTMATKIETIVLNAFLRPAICAWNLGDPIATNFARNRNER